MHRPTCSLVLILVFLAASGTQASHAAAQSSSGVCGEFAKVATAGGPDPLVENGPRLRWSTPVPEYIFYVIPIGDDQIGLAIVPGSNSSTAIVVLDAVTGNVNWCQELEWQEIGALGAVGGAVVATSREENLDNPGQTIAFDARSGAELWRLDRALTKAPWLLAGEGIIFDESQILLTAVDALTGQARWHYELPPGSIASVPVVAHGSVYIPTLSVEGQLGHTILTLDASTGEQRWSTAIEVEFEYFGVSSSPSGMLYVCGGVAGDRETLLLALDGETGNEVWQAAGPDYAFPLVTDQKLFVGMFSDFAAFDSTTGEELWRVQLAPPGYGGPIEGSSVVLEGQLVIVGTAYASTVPDGWPVVGVNVETGDVLWELSVDRPDLNEIPLPILAADAVILVSSELLALEIQR